MLVKNNKKIIKKEKKMKKSVNSFIKKKTKQVLQKTKLKASASKEKNEKPIGKITHFYDKIKVAVIKFNQRVLVGTKIHIKGANTDFNEVINSMEFDHKKIKFAPKGKLVGIKIHKIAKVNDLIYKI